MTTSTPEVLDGSEDLEEPAEADLAVECSEDEEDLVEERGQEDPWDVELSLGQTLELMLEPGRELSTQ